MTRIKDIKTEEELKKYLQEKFIKKYKRKIKLLKRKISKHKEFFKIEKYNFIYDIKYISILKKLSFEFTRNGIKIVDNLKEFWDDIKYFIPKTITILEVPFELIRDDLTFLKELPNLKKLIINDELHDEDIKLLYENTNIRDVYMNYLYEYSDYSNKKDYTIAKLDGCVSLVAYKDLLIRKNSAIKEKDNKILTLILKKDKPQELKEKICNLTIESHDLNEERIKMLMKLINVDSIYEIIIDIYSKNYFNTNFSYFEELSKNKKLRFKYDGYTEADIESFKNYTESLKWYKKIIKEADLSPVEKVMFAYDIMKTFKYKENPQDKKSSRQPHKIIETGNIVCVGYCRLLKEILNDLDENIKVGELNVFCYDKNKAPLGAHERSIIQIDDEKYNIHGIFTLDATWDSIKDNKKEIDSDYTALDLYSYFLIPTSDYTKVFPYDTIPSVFCEYLNIPQRKDKKTTIIDDYNYYFEGIFSTKFNKTISKEKLTKYLSEKGLSKKMFNKILYNVRIAEGYTHEQALKEIEKVNRINNKIINSEKELEENPPIIEKNLTKKKEI